MLTKLMRFVIYLLILSYLIIDFNVRNYLNKPCLGGKTIGNPGQCNSFSG